MSDTTLFVGGTRTFMTSRRYDPAHRVAVVGATLKERFDYDVVGDIDRVVSGGADGADQLGEAWAAASGMPVGPDDRFEPDWDEHGRSAGPIRNSEILEEADIVVMFWNGESAGSKDMIHKAQRADDVRLTVVRYDEGERPWDDINIRVTA